ncbi:hypothetical protein IKP85_06940 [bacterium]|nr:hypothetical protein [bacterium]
MLLQPANNVRNNQPMFGAKIVVKSPEVEQLMHICDDVDFTKSVMDEFHKIAPDQTVEISIKQVAENVRQLVAKNLNNGMECKGSEFKKNSGYMFYDFLEALITRYVKSDKFWQV